MRSKHRDARGRRSAGSTCTALAVCGTLAVLAALATGLSALSCARAQPAPARSTDSAHLRIRQLDVGQGDAALITTPEGRRILIDAGPDADAVAALLRAERIDTLDLVIASHNHADHIGGIAQVFAAVVVRAYVENGIPHTTATYRRTLAAVERERGLLYLQATARTIRVGSVSVRILPPPRRDSSHNANSVGALIEYGAFNALYTGDSEVSELETWLAERRVPRVTLVKVAHHGSGDATTAAWVRATSPAVAIISVAARNEYGHPAPAVERLWRAAGVAIYRTDLHGTIEVRATADGTYSITHTRAPR